MGAATFQERPLLRRSWKEAASFIIASAGSNLPIQILHGTSVLNKLYECQLVVPCGILGNKAAFKYKVLGSNPDK